MYKKIFVLLILFFLLIIVVFLSLFIGRGTVSFYEVRDGLLFKDESLSQIVWKLRLPRILLGLIVGGGLAACGCVFQGILRNPLAEPYTLGISGGAIFGTAIGMFVAPLFYSVQIFSFLGALLSIFIVYSIASKKKFSIPTIILTGVITSFLFSSVVLFIIAVSKGTEIQTTLKLLLGDLSSRTEDLYIPIVIVSAGIAFLTFFGREIDILTLGEEKAIHLGVDNPKVLKIVFVTASLITAICVSYAGIIGFVGLIIPHIMRQFVRPTHSFLIVTSSMAGAIFLVASDTLARIVYRHELPVGVITGILGGIFFLFLIFKIKEWSFA